MSEWISIDDAMPVSGVLVIAAYKNSMGYWRKIIGCYLKKGTYSCSDESECKEYIEDADEYYLIVG